MTPKKETTATTLPYTVFSSQLEFPMREELDVINITAEVSEVMRESAMSNGAATVFVPGATGVITCLEFEPGVVADFKAAMERMSPRDFPYEHDRYQADGNGCLLYTSDAADELT